MIKRTKNNQEIYIPCPLCHSQSYTVLYPSTLTSDDYSSYARAKSLKNSLDDFKKHGQLVRCNICHVIYVNPRESNKALLEGYENVTDTEYLETEKFRKALANRFLRMIEIYSKKGSLLDIGCFAGFFLELAKRNKWKTFGIEPSVWAASIAKKKGIKIIGKTLTPRIKYTFNVITLFDVIEHVDNPTEIITLAHSLLQKDGIIVVGTPNIDSLFAKIMGRNYPYLIRMHIILFSPAILKKLLEENGFKVIHKENYSRTYPLYYILTRLATLISPLQRLIKILPLKNPFFQIPIPIYTQDEFVMIAKKI